MTSHSLTYPQHGEIGAMMVSAVETDGGGGMSAKPDIPSNLGLKESDLTKCVGWMGARALSCLDVDSLSLS